MESNYKLTVRRRKPDGTLQTATYNLEHVQSSGDDVEQMSLLFAMEIQANGNLNNKIEDTVRVWVEER